MMRSAGYGAFVASMLLLAGCADQSDPAPQTAPDFALPQPISNNAVAAYAGPDGDLLFSFNGLQAGKSWQDTSNLAFACKTADQSCTAIAPVPVEEGRLASAAVTLGQKIYLFGGYTVAENGDERSTPEVFAFDPLTRIYERRADMPTPVDDMVVVAYQDRYIYLISGWHDEGNVQLVQLYDSQTDSWSVASEFPGKAVFGHAGGLAGNTIVITDGVAVAGLVDGKRKFVAAPFAWRGDIDPADPANIAWRPIDHHGGAALYRMASMGEGQRIIFAGGADNPYNYDGIGYDGEPASPSRRIFAYDVDADSWRELGSLPRPSMDHRGLVKSGDDYYIMGGMDADRQVTSRITKFRLDD